MISRDPFPDLSNLSGSRCLVLGASGFIGQNLCASLRHSVAKLRGFSRQRRDMDGVEWLEGDFSNADQIRLAVENVDTVFHLACSTTPASSNKNIESDAAENLMPSIRLLDVCREAKVERIIFVSSGGTVYGEPKQLPIHEGHPTHPICAYGISKLAVEKYFALYERIFGMKAICLRVSNPYGPYQNSAKMQGVIGAFISKALAGQPLEIWGDGSVIRDYIFVEDVIKALKLAANYNGEHRLFNIGSGVGICLNEIVDLLGNALGRSLNPIHRPSRSVDVSASVLDCRLAHDQLGWRAQTALKDGICHTLDWFRESNR